MPGIDRMEDLLVNSGLSMCAIASRLSMSEGIARQVAHRIYSQKRVTGRVELMAREIERLNEAMNSQQQRSSAAGS